MEGLAKLGIDGATLLAQVVNFSILFVLLYLVAYKPILKILDERSGKARESMEQAERIQKQAEEATGETRRQIETASKEGQEIIARAVHAGEEVKQKAQQDAKQEGEVLILRAKAEIQQERDDAIDGLRREFANLTILAAEKVIEVSLDEEAHRELIEKTLEESTGLRKN